MKNLAGYNDNRKKHGGRAVSVWKHLDPKSSQESFYLGGIVKKREKLPQYKDKAVHVLDMIDPQLVVDAKQFKLDQLPKDFSDLVGPYNGF